MAAKKRSFAPGDRVAMSAAWLKSTQCHDAAKLRGTVLRECSDLTKSTGTQFVKVAWDGMTHLDYDGNPTDSKTVNSQCLAKIGSAAFADTYA